MNRHTTYDDGTYAGLIGAVLRARERTGCELLAISIRGDRAAIILHIPLPGEPGASFSHYVSAFCSPAHLRRLEAIAEAITPDVLLSHLQVASSIARDPRRLSTLARWTEWYRGRAALVRRHAEAGRC